MRQTLSAQATIWDAVVTAVHDGDTFDATVILGPAYQGLDVDYGFHIYKEHPNGGPARIVLHTAVRLLGCNARELNQPGGQEARAALLSVMPVGALIRLHTTSPDKYGGRYDAEVTLPDGRDLVSLLISEQWAAPWSGSGTKPVPPWPRTI